MTPEPEAGGSRGRLRVVVISACLFGLAGITLETAEIGRNAGKNVVA